MEDIKRRELGSLNFSKTVLMILIVFYHAINYWRSWFVGDPVFKSAVFYHLAAWLDSFHIYGFALISGYLFYYLRFELGKYDNYLDFIKNKTLRLIIPYVFVSAVWVIPISFPFFNYDLATIVNNYVLGQSPSQLWFLLMLFWVFIIFWPLAKFFKEHNWIGIMVVFAFWCLSIVGGKIMPNYFMIWKACGYIPIFWLGFKLRQLDLKFLRKIPFYVWIIVDVLIYIALLFLPQSSNLIIKAITIGGHFVLNVVGALMSFFVLAWISERIGEAKPIKFLSKYSMPIYLFHQQLIYIPLYFLNGLVEPHLHGVINFVLGGGVALLISMVMMKFKVTRFLIGEK